MKNMLLKSALFAFVGVGLTAGSAMALSLDYFTGDAGDSVYNDTGAEYVVLTDLTDPASAPMIQLSTTILSDYNQDYIIGIFDWDGSDATTLTSLSVLDTYLNTTSSNVIFDIGLGTATSALGTESIDDTFGFYLQFYSDIGSGNLTSETYYSDPILGGDEFSLFYDPMGIQSTGFSEMALGIGGPTTQGHALVSIDDVKPVPEPTTMLLFGTGLVGLAGISRRRKK